MPSSPTSGVTESSEGWTGGSANEHGSAPGSLILQQQKRLSDLQSESMIRIELMQRIMELRMENDRLRRDLADAKLQVIMAPLPAGSNKILRAALASVDWAETLEEAQAIAQEALRK